jgi:sortase (surface protein transpeptidase)
MDPGTSGSRRRVCTHVMLVAMLIGGCAASKDAAGNDSAARDSTVPPSPATRPRTDPAMLPTRIVIPSIGVSADLELLHRDNDGSLQTPKDWNKAGWYADGVIPGNRGPAVIVGHVDSARDGPAVFYRLPQLKAGDDVSVQSRDGHIERFLVDAARQFPKNRFPTDLVYGPTPLRELRLVTCAGSFDHATGSYSDNLIVTAYAASTPQL